MSRLSKLQRKAALLRFHLIKHGDFPKNEKHRIDLLGIARAGLEKWIRGEVLRPRSLESVDERVKEVLVLDSMMPNLFENYIGVMEFGKLLGLTRRECQIAIDTVAGELGPTFSIFSMQRGRADSLLSDLQGLYAVYRMERTKHATLTTGRDESVLRMALSVRYRLPGSKLMSRDLQRVRCKLNIPSYRAPVDIHEYDGYITPSDASGEGRHYWMFEVRQESEKDAVFFMTESLRRGPHHAPQRRLALGIMVSRTQDTKSVPAIWPIVIERRADLPDVSEPEEGFEQSAEQRFVTETAALLEPKSVGKWVFNALKEAEEFATFMTTKTP